MFQGVTPRHSNSSFVCTPALNLIMLKLFYILFLNLHSNIFNRHLSYLNYRVADRAFQHNGHPDLLCGCGSVIADYTDAQPTALTSFFIQMSTIVKTAKSTAAGDGAL